MDALGMAPSLPNQEHQRDVSDTFSMAPTPLKQEDHDVNMNSLDAASSPPKEEGVEEFVKLEEPEPSEPLPSLGTSNLQKLVKSDDVDALKHGVDVGVQFLDQLEISLKAHITSETTSWLRNISTQKVCPVNIFATLMPKYIALKVGPSAPPSTSAYSRCHCHHRYHPWLAGIANTLVGACSTSQNCRGCCRQHWRWQIICDQRSYGRRAVASYELLTRLHRVPNRDLLQLF